jgi:hypothetical protein
VSMYPELVDNQARKPDSPIQRPNDPTGKLNLLLIACTVINTHEPVSFNQLLSLDKQSLTYRHGTDNSAK